MPSTSLGPWDNPINLGIIHKTMKGYVMPNKIGPRIDLCGTPHLKWAPDEETSSVLSENVLSRRNLEVEEIQQQQIMTSDSTPPVSQEQESEVVMGTESAELDRASWRFERKEEKTLAVQFWWVCVQLIKWIVSVGNKTTAMRFKKKKSLRHPLLTM